MAMTFATKFRARTVLLGITVATALVHLASVLLGNAVGGALPTGAISVVAGIAFLGFAAWTLRGDTLTAEERSKAGNATGSALFAVGRGVLPRRARRQDHVGHHHARRRPRPLRHLGRQHLGHGGRRRPRDPAWPLVGPTASGEGGEVRRGGSVRDLRGAADRARAHPLSARVPTGRRPRRRSAGRVGYSLDKADERVVVLVFEGGLERSPGREVGGKGAARNMC